jgi:dihydroorotase-like cyclic amidohydrolase
MPRYDTAILNGTVVLPDVGAIRCDVGVRDGRVAGLADRIEPRDADQPIDARGRLVLPGAVDSHFHIGIYRDLALDAESETRSALAGGVTTVVSYFRTGSHYLNKTGPYRTIFPEVVAATEGHAYTDFGYHLGIMTTDQLDEVDWLVGEQGVASFKYYMFYKGLNLTSDSTRGTDYGARGRISLSLHCEQAELLRVFIEEARRTGAAGLEAYHRARPPLTEQLSIAEALVLADATRCPVNLLHLSSAEAVTAGSEGRRRHPDLDIRLETTLHHLALTYDTAGGAIGKVNPPIRTDADREALKATSGRRCPASAGPRCSIPISSVKARAAGSRSRGSSRSPARIRRAPSACSRARAPSRWGATPTSWSWIPSESAAYTPQP